MSELRATTEPIGAQPDDVVLPDTLFVGSSDDLTVVLELPASALPLLADYVPGGASASVQGDRIRTTLRVAHYHGLKRLVTGLAGVVTVIEPAEARDVVAEWAAAGAARYDRDPERAEAGAVGCPGGHGFSSGPDCCLACWACWRGLRSPCSRSS